MVPENDKNHKMAPKKLCESRDRQGLLQTFVVSAFHLIRDDPSQTFFFHNSMDDDVYWLVIIVTNQEAVIIETCVPNRSNIFLALGLNSTNLVRSHFLQSWKWENDAKIAFLNQK